MTADLAPGPTAAASSDPTPDAHHADGRSTPPARVALVSSGEHAHLDADLPLLVDALARRGVDATVVDWHDGAFAWEDVDLAVIRSTWDYTWQLDRFLDWVERVSARTRLANPSPVVRWNTDKRYLLDLAAADVPTVASRVLAPGDDPAAADAVAPGQPVVVKPVVSAGALDTRRFDRDERAAARADVQRLLDEGRSVLVQPYLAAIDEHGETGLVFLGDTFSHAFRKAPILAPTTGSAPGLPGEEDITPRTASPAELDVAHAALDAVATAVSGCSRRDLLYARVDLVPHDDGPVVLELELVEPSLFCSIDSTAAERAADAIARSLA